MLNGDVTNDGTFSVTGTSVMYTGFFDHNGAYLSEMSSSYFNNLFIGIDGYLAGADDDLFSIGGDFMN